MRTWVRRTQVSGGSAGNTAAGVAALGRPRRASSARSRPTSWANSTAHDMTAAGVEFTTPRGATSARRPRARMILVTPDGQRTMNTFLGAAQHLARERARRGAESRRRRSSISKAICGIPETPRQAMVARSRSRTRPGARSPSPCRTCSVVDRHRDGFNQLLDEQPDRHPVRQPGGNRGAGRSAAPRSAVAAVKDRVETLVVTRSEDGALATRGGERADVPAEPIDKLVDTTGAGDLFAAGFLARRGARARARALAAARRDRAAEVIQHYGARPEADLRALAGGVLA